MFVDTYCCYYISIVIWIFYMGIKFRVLLINRVITLQNLGVDKPTIFSLLWKRSIWMTGLQCLTFIHKGLRNIFMAINWFLLQQVKDKSCVCAEVWFTRDPRLLSHGRLWMRRWRMDAGYEDWWHKGTCLTSTSFHACDMDINFLISVFRKLFITILTSGATKIHTTLQEEGLGLIHKRPSCQPTGTQPSPRSASVWWSATR